MRAPRTDFAGADWLITNRGIAKRAVFETRRDVERFCEALARVVERGLVEVDAFVFMTTHFHLLVHSRTGEISLAMKLVTNEFVRWFNRVRKRDGPLFAGRFDGRRITDSEHWNAALRYIDLNPVRAGMCRAPSEHPFGSARSHRFGAPPAWLATARVRATQEEFHAPRCYEPRLYDGFAGRVDAEANAYVIESALRHPSRPPPPLEDLVRSASLRQQGWMAWKAALADGMRIGTAFLSPEAALHAARRVHRLLQRAELPVAARTVERDVSVGLLRHSAGRGVREIADDLAIACATVYRSLRRHHEWMTSAPAYAEAVNRALADAVRREYGARLVSPSPPRRAPASLGVSGRSG